SNTPVFIQAAFSEVMEILRGVETREEFKAARKNIHGIVKACKSRLQQKAYLPEELAISVQMTKRITSYKGNPQHIKAARQLENHRKRIRQDENYSLEPGTIIRFVKSITDDGVTSLEAFDKVKHPIDAKAYEIQLESTFAQVLDTLGITLFESQKREKRARAQKDSLLAALSDEDLKKKVNIGEVMTRTKKTQR
ncbi:MAG: hypothetical protein ACXAEL_05300, partial [Candidatus Hodarchaeales archaeon]